MEYFLVLCVLEVMALLGFLVEVIYLEKQEASFFFYLP